MSKKLTPQEIEKRIGKNKILIPIIIVLLVGLSIMVGVEEGKRAPKETVVEEVEPVKKIDTMFYAKLAAKKNIEDQLVAPSTAEFQPVYEMIVKQSSDSFEISSYVDAQNSFGAMLRQDWICRMKYTGGDPDMTGSWDPVLVVIGDEIVVDRVGFKARLKKLARLLN